MPTKQTKKLKPTVKENVEKDKKQFLKDLLKISLYVLLGVVCGCGVGFTIKPTEEGVVIEPTKIELSPVNYKGSIELSEPLNIELPTLLSVDSGELPKEDMPDSAQGAYHDTSSPKAYADAVIGECIDVDGKYGAQCFDLASDFWKNYANRWLSSCGTGAAKGVIEEGCWQKNAGDDFEMVWDAHDLQAGDWVVFTNGQYGHIGMALGGYNNGYVALLGENQGGKACAGGGAAANTINISLKWFGGAFRPKSFIKPEPKPTPQPNPTPKNPDTGAPRTKE